MKKISKRLDTINSNTSYNEALVEELINELESCGSYSSEIWDVKEIESIGESLSKLADKQFAVNFLHGISKLCVNTEGEAFLLVKFLFELNYLKDNPKSFNDITVLNSEYSENHAYAYQFIKMAHELEDINLELLENIHKIGVNLVMKTVDPFASHTYVSITINISMKLFYNYIARHDFVSAKRLIVELDNVKPFTESIVINNVLAGLPFAVKQNEALYNLNKSTLEDIESKVNKLSEDNNKKTFEILIVFTAVITFLVTAAGKAASDSMSISGLGAFGFTLLVFIITSIICLERPKNIFSDTRILVLILAILSALVMALVDKYDKFELWSDKTINIEFSQELSKENPIIKIPFKLE